MADAAHGSDPLDTGHDYDGIHEHDNRLPNWWLATLFGTTIFAYGYWMAYHVFETPSTVARWEAGEAEIAARANATPADDKVLLALSHDSGLMAKTQATFKQQCSACHGENGEGKIGPNLTDAVWIHGPKPTEVYAVIGSGVLQKGMPAWKPVLGEERVRALAAYVQTLRGKNLPGRPPEGDRKE